MRGKAHRTESIPPTSGEGSGASSDEKAPAKSSPASQLVDLLPAILVVLPAIVFVWDATSRASWASLGRDQGIFQYVAWAIGEGEVAYRDVRDVNGPVITMVHLFFQVLGGADEHRFRVLDLLFNGISFVIAGALVPFMFPKRAGTTNVSNIVARPIAWALAAWVALTAQYVAYGFWDTAQRESFLDWFVLVSIALQAASSSRAAGDNDDAPQSQPQLESRRTKIMLFLAGAMSFIPWLGKPTFALFTTSQVVAILIDDEVPRRMRVRRLGIFALGAVAGVVPPFLFILMRGDVRAWARITFVDVPAMYRFIWPRPASVILSMPGYNTLAMLAVATTGALCFLIAVRALPRRALPIAVMPALGLLSVVVQAKGFPYHFHPVTLGLSFAWIVAVAARWSTATTTWRRLVVIVAAMLVGGRASVIVWEPPYPPVPIASARDKVSLESPQRLAAYDRIDFFPRALRDAAEYVTSKTQPGDRVQTYGMDAYVLFLANRKSATPYIYAYDLNVDAALRGSYDPGGLLPSPEEAARIRAMGDAHVSDFFARLERAPPAAFVFIDRSPLMNFSDSVEDFSVHCPDVAVWLSTRYHQTADFEGIRVWLRDDLAASGVRTR